MSTDATKCAVCGGEFSEKRIVIDGAAMHTRCALSSYGSHTSEDMAKMGSKMWELYDAAKEFEAGLSDLCDGPERERLRKALSQAYC